MQTSVVGQTPYMHYFRLLYNYFQVRSLPPPYKSKCKNKKIFGTSVYSKPLCFEECRTRFIIKECHCRSAEMQGKSRLLLNYNEKYKEDNKITRKYDDEDVFENYYTCLPINLAKILRILSLGYLSDQGRLFIYRPFVIPLQIHIPLSLTWAKYIVRSESISCMCNSFA